jgi:hypothetical protein
MNKPLLLLISAGCLVSCHKEASNPANNWTWFGTPNSAVYNYVLINANQVLSNSDSEELHIGVSAAFIDSNNHQVTIVRTLLVNNQVIQPDQDSTYSYNYNFTPGEINKGSELFGSKVLVTIRGMDDADTVTSSVYVPKQLTGTITSYPEILSLSKGIQLQWTPDNQNTWGNVLVQLYYYSSLSQKADSTLPSNISTVSLTVPDNGSYFLTKNDLSAFPCNAYIGITIARGTQNEALLPLSRKRVYYFSSASVSTPPVKLIQ